MEFDHSYDMVIVGSGGGGLMSSLIAKDAGLDVLIIEKQATFGGSTALSGGGIWAPNNRITQKAGVEDSRENVLLYLENTVGDKVPLAKREAYADNAPKMINWLLDNTNIKLKHVPNYSDYHPERPGGVAEGRSIESVVYNGKKLKDDLKFLNKGTMEVPMNLAFNIEEYKHLGLITSTWKGKWIALKAGMRGVFGTLLGRKLLALGAALVAQLRLAVKERDIPLWLECPMRELIYEDDRVIGVIAEKDGKEIRIEGKQGVLLAAGGFPHNLEMREKYMSGPQSTKWTSASPGNTGDGIRAGLAVGAKVDQMDDAWWGPSSYDPDGGAFFHVAERSLPGSIMVNGEGKRFTNEAASYVTVTHKMYELHTEENHHVPSYFVFYRRFKKKYIFGTNFPGQDFTDEQYENGYIKKADSIAELAELIGVPADNLQATIERFNGFAREGEDEDFGRGNNAYDQYYGDPTVKPNSNLHPLQEAPYYAVKFWPGDLGTKGGLMTNEYAQVLREDGSIIDGLYAAGNNMASVMGRYYPGPGSAVGSTMTYGYIAANHIKENDPEDWM